MIILEVDNNLMIVYTSSILYIIINNDLVLYNGWRGWGIGNVVLHIISKNVLFLTNVDIIFKYLGNGELG